MQASQRRTLQVNFRGLGLSMCESAPYLQNVCINATGQNQVKLPAESDQISEEKQTFVSERVLQVFKDI